MSKKVFIAADHAGFELKETLKPYIEKLGFEVEDFGSYKYDESDDYPDMMLPCAQKVSETPGSFGIVIGASGQGEAMVANRVKGVRAALYYGELSSTQIDISGNTLTMIASVRAHNDANILALGARFISEDEAKRAVNTFLKTPFSNDERHVRRIKKIDA